ncbi:phage tail protein [Bacteroides sp.]|uniref:phage tail protein n=1 Tax=Bacteroides sp. TaxID=29523 RepID=UPI002616B65D|nr:tail fiber protein [Bacteroides sp.]MDD3040982.1 tail fiber protein [Bacteroides sp.]
MEYFIGEILLLPFSFAPYGSIQCAGQTLQVAQFQALYSLIGNQYGGSPGVTFLLPNLSGTEPLPGMRYCIMTEGIYPSRP